jgi:hypothetical protein
MGNKDAANLKLQESPTVDCREEVVSAQGPFLFFFRRAFEAEKTKMTPKTQIGPNINRTNVFRCS